MALVECVPNFSEGRRSDVIEAIAEAIRSTPGCKVLDVDPGTSTNRTVYTFVGSPEAVVEGALNAAKVAFNLIDMSRHSGEHPRMGAMDVCPFIPLRGVTMQDCVQCAEKFGSRLAEELDIPVYLYAAAARNPQRKTLPQVRSGEYEGLKDKVLKPEWKPDFGPSKFVPSWGATATGARKFLIAYNVNVLSTKDQAHRIALNIREQGRSADQPGRLKHVQGIGWWLEESNIAQVSVNILDHDETPIHEVYEECLKDGKEMKLAITGSQIVGLVPLNALLQVAEFYMQKDDLFILEEDQKVRLAVERLGLSSISQFVPNERIIEYMVQEEEKGLLSLDLDSFIKTVGARTASPGGGTVAALCSTLGASLSSMVGLLSYGNRKFEHLDHRMRRLIPPFYKAIQELKLYIDRDAEAYNAVVTSNRLPKTTDEEIQIRDEAVQKSLEHAAQVPLDLAILTNTLWTTLKELSQIGNINCKSDLQVAAKCMETGVFGARCNVLTNLDSVDDSKFVSNARKSIENAWNYAQGKCQEVLEILDNRSA